MNDEHDPPRLDAMSNEPPWLRDALGEARRARPGTGDLARLAERVSAATGVVVAPPTDAPPPATSDGGTSGAGASGGAATAWWTGVTKIGIAVVLVGGVGGGATYLATRGEAPVERAPMSAPAATSSSAVTAPVVEAATPTTVDSSSASGPAAPRASSSAIASSRPSTSPSIVAPSAEPSSAAAREPETVLIERARKQLASSPSAALATTEAHARDYPRGALSQERDVVAIEALLRLGRRTDAERRAEAFRSREPTSPYRRRIERLLAPDDKSEP